MVALLIDSVRCAACVRERRAKIAALGDSLRLLMLMMFLTIARRRSAASSMKWIARPRLSTCYSARPGALPSIVQIWLRQRRMWRARTPSCRYWGHARQGARRNERGRPDPRSADRTAVATGGDRQRPSCSWCSKSLGALAWVRCRQA